MANKITLPELEAYLWGSADILRGKMDAGSYKQYIFPLLFFKRLNDVYEEETAKAVAENGEEAAEWEEIHSYKIPSGAHWEDVRNVPSDVGKAIVTAFRAMEKANSEKLMGIFGDGTWTNKNRLPDRLLKDLLEHFSKHTLSLENCPEDELGQGYEYLIKQFADDSGHTAQEFYTNRTVVHLMTEILQPKSGESIYDPTCGSAGMLISAIVYLQRHKKEWRNVSLYGQEINMLSSAIGRMNLFLHGIEDFQIVNGDTLANPAFTENGKLRQFDMIVANPPYSISQWNREAFENDKYGRNFLGVPTQRRADFAFVAHILKSLNEHNGRCAILLPNGILNRYEEGKMRIEMVKHDYVECVIGLGKNLFYNSPMEACVLICRTKKVAERVGRVLFINATHMVHREGTYSYLSENDIGTIVKAYKDYSEQDGLCSIATIKEILNNEGSLRVSRYVRSVMDIDESNEYDEEVVTEWLQASRHMHESCKELMKFIGGGDINDC